MFSSLTISYNRVYVDSFSYLTYTAARPVGFKIKIILANVFPDTRDRIVSLLLGVHQRNANSTARTVVFARLVLLHGSIITVVSKKQQRLGQIHLICNIAIVLTAILDSCVNWKVLSVVKCVSCPISHNPTSRISCDEAHYSSNPLSYHLYRGTVTMEEPACKYYVD